MKKNKALLLGSTVLFSVMGSIEKANSAEDLNSGMIAFPGILEGSGFGQDCINHEPIRKEELFLDYKEKKGSENGRGNQE